MTSDSLVYRYHPAIAADDGLRSPEGTFTPCSFWLAEALARAGRVDEARLMLEKMLTYSNHVGLAAPCSVAGCRGGNDHETKLLAPVCDRIGVFAEGLGGFVVFYLALTQSPMKSVVLENAPAILNDDTFQEAIRHGKGTEPLIRSVGKRGRKIGLPVAKLLLRMFPSAQLPISAIISWRGLIDTKEGNREVETRLVEAYLHDPDFDRWYPLSAIISMQAPPPHPLNSTTDPYHVHGCSKRNWGSAFVEYLKDVYQRLPNVKKRLVEVDGSVYWMLSHPKEAADVICAWFDETL